MKLSRIRFGNKPISTKQIVLDILCQAKRGSTINRMNQVINLKPIKSIKQEGIFDNISIKTGLINQESISLVRIGSQWFDSTLYTSVFKFPPGGALIVINGLPGVKGDLYRFQ